MITNNEPQESNLDTRNKPVKKRNPKINVKEIISDIGNEYISDEENKEGNSLINIDQVNEILKKKAEEKKLITSETSNINNLVIQKKRRINKAKLINLLILIFK